MGLVRPRRAIAHIHPPLARRVCRGCHGPHLLVFGGDLCYECHRLEEIMTFILIVWCGLFAMWVGFWLQDVIHVPDTCLLRRVAKIASEGVEVLNAFVDTFRCPVWNVPRLPPGHLKLQPPPPPPPPSEFLGFLIPVLILLATSFTYEYFYLM